MAATHLIQIVKRRTTTSVPSTKRHAIHFVHAMGLTDGG